QPGPYRLIGLEPHGFGNNVGIQDDHSSFIGSAGVSSRDFATAARSSSVNPTFRPKEARASPKRTRAAGLTAAVRISRTSASVLRPCRAALAFKARCTSSDRLRTVSMDMTGLLERE